MKKGKECNNVFANFVLHKKIWKLLKENKIKPESFVNNIAIFRIAYLG